MMSPEVCLGPMSPLPGAVRRHLRAIPAERGAAKTPVMRLRAIIKPQHALLSGASADDIKVGIGQQVRDGFGDRSEEFSRRARQICPLDPPLRAFRDQLGITDRVAQKRIQSRHRKSLLRLSTFQALNRDIPKLTRRL